MTSESISCELIGDLPAFAAQAWGDRAALASKGNEWTYREFAEEVDVIARALLAAGVRQGDRVAVWLPNSPEIQFLLFAITRIGALMVPLNTRYKVMDLTHALQHSGSRLLVSCTRWGPVDFESILVEALGPTRAGADGRPLYEGAPRLQGIVMLGEPKRPDIVTWKQFRGAGLEARPEASWPKLDPGDAALMMFTSGTTGRAKGVLLDHSGMRLCLDRVRIMGMRADDVQLTYLPLFHIYAIGYSVIMSFLCGASQVLMDVFNGDEALRLIEEYRVTAIHGFEAHFGDLLAAQSRSRRNIGSLRIASFATGAESVRPLAERVQAELCSTSASYGLTEMWGGITISPPSATLSQRCEGSGLAQPGIEIRIVEPATAEVLPAGHVGEIQVRGYTRMIAYQDDPEATAAAFSSEGWFSTGDAGLLREDGHLRCLARYKDMLKVGGENVAPAEIEHFLCSIPGVKMAAVVGQKTERLQEVPVAFLVISGETALTQQQVIDSFKGRMASFKIPRRVIFVDELPMTSTGKVQKEVLRRRLSGEEPNDGR